MKRNCRRHRLVAWTAVAAVALVGSACSSTASSSTSTTSASTAPSTTGAGTGSIPASAFTDRTGITANSVSVANISTLSAGLFKGSPVGTQAYADYVNSTGGINGRKMDVTGYDDQFQGAQNAQSTNAAVGQDFALVGGFSLEDSFGAAILAKNPGVPSVGESIEAATNALPNYYSPVPQQPGYQEGSLQYFKKKYPSDIGAVGTLIGNLPSNATTWAGDKYAMTKVGYKVSYVGVYGVTQTDYNADVVAMKNAGVKMLFLDQMNDTYASSVMKALNQQSFHPVVILGAAAYTASMVSESGGAANVDGSYLSMQYSLFLGQDSPAIPAVSTFLHWIQVASPGFKPDLFSLYGWLSAEMFAQALKNAGSNPSRGSVLQQLAKVTSFNGQGLMAPTNPAAHTISNCYLLVQVANGDFVRIDDPPISGTTGGFRCDYTFLSPPKA